MKLKTRTDYRARRHRRVRRKISGSADRPRMSIMVSNKYMYVQFIDDVAGRTLAAASTQKLDGVKNNLDGAKRLGQAAAQSAIDKGIKTVVVDRGGFQFHGRVKAIVDAACAAGLVTRVNPPRGGGEAETEGKEAT